MDQEVNVVFYGDHLPALTKTLYNNSSLTNYSDQTVAKFATPYFIWNNQGKKLTSPSLVNPEFLTASVLEQSNLDLSVFQRLTADLSHSIEAFKTTGPAYYKNNQEITLTPSEQNMLKAYQLLQYDHLFGYDYAKELFE
ncbi:sulfatase-like hydrolase/transferase [Vagococcus salmoninarum]|uniref:sulfatase-like hydrolase/transferase n=1 Tax=Vagococcus salmoninarum TaxID=2739 RepID=UPI00398B3A68